LARPALFFWLAVGVFSVWVMTLATVDADFPVLGADLAFLRAFAFPALAGLLAGLTLQGLQHCWFTWLLPGVRWRTALGFTVLGLFGSLLVVALQAQRESQHGFWSLLAIGFAGYCVGALLYEPRASVSTWSGFLAFLSVWLFSARIGAFFARHPELALAATMAIASFTLWHRFRKSTFRRVPFLPVSEMLGSFSMTHAERRERQKLTRRPLNQRRLSGPLRGDVADWVRAGLYESFGRFSVRELVGRLGWSLLIVLAIVILHATSRTDGGLTGASFQTGYHLIFDPPHLPPPVGDPPQAMIAFLSTAVCLTLMGMIAGAFDSNRHYPISRRLLGAASYRLSLVVSVGYFAALLGFFGLIGSLSGWMAGIAPRYDFMPFFVRVALVSFVLLPVAQTAGFRRNPRSEGVAMFRLIFVGVCFVAVVAVWSLNGGSIVPQPAVELALLLVLVIASQLTFRRYLQRYFRTRDLI